MTDNRNQCDYCAFKQTEDQSTQAKARLIENKYDTIRSAKGAPPKTRGIHIGGDDDKTETCFIDSPMWEKRREHIHCPDRLDNSLSLETALALREARTANSRAEDANKLADRANNLAEDANRAARAALIWAIIAAIIAVIAIILPYIIPAPK